MDHSIKVCWKVISQLTTLALAPCFNLRKHAKRQPGQSA